MPWLILPEPGHTSYNSGPGKTISSAGKQKPHSFTILQKQESL